MSEFDHRIFLVFNVFPAIPTGSSRFLPAAAAATWASGPFAVAG